MKQFPNRDLAEIDALQFHKRIFQRQNAPKRRLKYTKTMRDHTFAEMLDYVIQYVGELVPFIKDGSPEPVDELIAYVTRVDTKTGKKTECKAEYAFGQKGDDVYVYHRLLRPIKK